MSDFSETGRHLHLADKPAHRTDPYRNYRFRLKWDGRYVAGISKVSALKSTTEVVEFRTAGNPNNTRKLPGRTNFEAVTLERGVTHDTAFEDWASQVWKAGSAGSGGGLGNATLQSFRKDVVLELRDESSKLIAAYKIRNCWVSEYQALPDLDAGGNAVAIQQIKLENEGFERDDSLAGPAAGGGR